jgi:tyrosinase
LPRQKLINAETYKYGIPIIFTLPKIQVRRPEDPSTLVPMDNPLYRFDFPQKDVQSIDWTEGFGNDYNKVVSQNTIRGYDGSAPSANHSFVMATFDNNYNPNVNLGSPDPGSLWRVMLDNQNWMTMSNHFDSTNRRASNYTLNSLEGFHDDIHGYLGSGPNSGNGDSPSGHMAMPQYAG